MHHDVLDAVLQRAFPMGHAYLRSEGGLELMHHTARALISTPSIAREVLGAKGTKAMAGAVRTLSQRYAAIADRLDELAAGEPSGFDRASCGSTNGTPSNGGARA
jgi:hypothetical protein